MWNAFSDRFTWGHLNSTLFLLFALNLIPLIGLALSYNFHLVFWTVLAAVTLYTGKKCLQFVYNYFMASVIVYGEMSVQSQMHKWLLIWITDKIERPKHLLAYNCNEFGDQSDDEQSLRLAKCTPTYGVHLFKYEGHWVILERTLHKDIRSYHITYESIKLTTYYKNKDILQKILSASIPPSKNLNDNTTRILDPYDDCSDWDMGRSPTRLRKVDTVILPEGKIESMIKDAKTFTEKEEWYYKRGIPHRRGYLLYGPPGNGKSSCVKAVAGALKADICVLPLSHKGLSDTSLNNLMNKAPKGSIILLEDIDAAFKSREDENATSSETNLAFEGASCSRITFRGLLNALDGVSSMEGRIVFMTSNYAEKLDPALIRPGRVDVKLCIDNPDQEQIARMFSRFYPLDELETEEEREELDEIKMKLVKKMCDLDKPISMSMIQGLFIIYSENAKDALENVSSFFKDQFSIATISRTPPPTGMYG